MAGLLAGARGFLSYTRVQSGSGARSASLLLGKWGAYTGIIELEREADHSHPFIVEVKNK